ncbi:MAG: hypothetical protein IKT98_06355 [Selenomonadaceae bacterium]|nr:hypothetical protein [Selenomonadaceae bacterium]
MATREENLKKINDELEQLSDEQLDKVAGGGWIDMIDTKNPFTDTATDKKPVTNHLLGDWLK